VDSEQQTYLYVGLLDMQINELEEVCPLIISQFIDTANDIGNTIKKRKKLIKGRVNKAFAHFRY
jgi:hypothetical protein